MFCRTPGAIRGGQTGDTAGDGYRRWREDVRLMRDLGIKACRFSVSWPRVLSEGTGALSDRVTQWMTMNEPQCFVGLGHQSGIHAPGDRLALDARGLSPRATSRSPGPARAGLPSR